MTPAEEQFYLKAAQDAALEVPAAHTVTRSRNWLRLGFGLLVYLFAIIGLIATGFIVYTLTVSPTRLEVIHFDDRTVTTTMNAWDRVPFYREIELKDGTTMYGPLSASGSKHGDWTTDSPNTGSPDLVQVKHHFYWYGEEISEAQWYAKKDAKKP